MRLRPRIVLLSLLIALVVSGVAAQAASAGKVDWIVNGKFLEEGKEVKASTVVGAIEIRWTRGTVNFTFKCTGGTDTETLEGNGRDKITAISFTGCTVTEPAGCRLEAGSPTVTGLPWNTSLIRGNQDLIENVQLTVKIEGCTNAGNNGRYPITGLAIAEWSNAKAELTFPETPIEGDTLEVEGDSAVLTGSDKFELEGGGTLEVGVECNGGHQSVFCYDDSVEIQSEEISGTSGLSLLEGKIGGGALKIECKDDTFKGLLEQLGASKGSFELLGCAVSKPTGCSIGEPIKAHFADQLSTGLIPATDLLTGTGAGEEFAKLTITGGSCAIAGEYALSGLQTTELPKGEESLAKHEVVAKKTGSKLKIGSETASFSSTNLIHLTSNLAWLVMLGS